MSNALGIDSFLNNNFKLQKMYSSDVLYVERDLCTTECMYIMLKEIAM